MQSKYRLENNWASAINISARDANLAQNLP